METQNCKIEAVDKKEKDKFDEIKKAFEASTKVFEFMKIPVIVIGEKKISVPGYEGVKERLTPKEYFNFISQIVNSPQDIHKIINPPFAKAKEIENDIDDLLLTATETLARGGADCDNLSWLAKKLFDKLSCKVGFNYNARVIAMKGHAICIYTDRDGQLYALDQGAPIKKIQSIAEGSAIFMENKESTACREVFLSEDGKICFEVEIDEKTLKPNYKKITAIIQGEFDESKVGQIDVDKIFPKDWKKYESVIILYRDAKTGSRNFFKVKLNTTQKNLPNGIIEFHEDRKLPKGGRAVFLERRHPDGKNEWYRKIYENGKLYEDVLDIRYPDGTLELYENGKLVRKREIRSQ